MNVTLLVSNQKQQSLRKKGASFYVVYRLSSYMKKYTQKKKRNQLLQKYISRFVSGNSYDLIKNCGSFLMMKSDITKEIMKVHKADFCKNRFCPMCAWRKANKDALAISVMMEYIVEEQDKDFLFLTLTAPTVPADQLEDEIQKFNAAFKKMFERKELKTIVKGYIRKLEVTYDSEQFITKKMYKGRQNYYDRKGLKFGDDNPNYGKYHPHFHVLIAVNKSYFVDAKSYLSRERWLELWQDATGDDSITQVDIRKFKKHQKGTEINEIAKYSAKDNDYLQSEEVFEVFYLALKGKRLLVYSGVFKDANTKYKNGELKKYMKEDTTEYVYLILYAWGESKYIQREIQEISADYFQQKLIDEIETE